MDEQLEKKLYADFPVLFQEHRLDMMQTCMCWGLECGDGWEPIIRNMCEVLNSKSRDVLEKKELFPYKYKLEVWLHNKCRKIEKLLKLRHGKLYTAKFDRYVSFSGFGVKFSQIKEKFGTLRVHYDIFDKYTEEEVKGVTKDSIEKARARYSNYVNGVTSFAEHLSSITCENDGNAGKLHTKGWWRVLCEDCAKPKTTVQ